MGRAPPPIPWPALWLRWCTSLPTASGWLSARPQSSNLLDTQYFIDRGAVRDVVLHPWRMRPSVVIELSADVVSTRRGP